MRKRYVASIAIFVPLFMLVLFLVNPCSQIFTLLVDRFFGIPFAAHATNEQVLSQAQDDVNLMNAVIAALGAVLAVVTVGAGVLGFFGFSNLKEMHETQEKIKATLQSANEAQAQVSKYEQDFREKLSDSEKTINGKIADLDTLINNTQAKMNTQSQTLAVVEEQQNFLIYLFLGTRLLEQNMTRQAIEALKEAKKLRPDDLQTNYALGRAYSIEERYDEAIECLDSATKADGHFYQGWFQLGLNYRYRGTHQQDTTKRDADYQQATQHLERAINLHSNYWQALGTLGGLYRRLGNYEEALKCYRRAFEVGPNTSYGPGNIAILSYHLGKLDDAQHYFRLTEKLAYERIQTGQEEEPYWDYYDLAMAQFVLGSLNKDEGQKAAALDIYKQAIQKTTGKEAYDGVIGTLQLLQEAKFNPLDVSEIVAMLKDAQAKSV